MISHVAALLQHLYQEIRSHMDRAVVAMSGGADSTLVAILCQKALGNKLVHTLHLPMNRFDETHFNELSLKIAHHLGVDTLKFPITDAVTALNYNLSSALGEPLSLLNEGNTRARIRMAALYGVSHALGDRYPSQRVRVVGTGNLSEDFIGYDTKGGDALADIFPIGELFKSEVYQLLEYFASEGVIEESMINRVPSAGLWPGQTDESELGFTYDRMEVSVRKIKAESWSDFDAVDTFVKNRHQMHRHKHEAPVVIRSRFLCS